MAGYVKVDQDGRPLVYQGPKGVDIFRMRVILSGLRLECKTQGRMQLTRGPKCSTIVRREYGLKGNREKLLAQFEKLVRKAEREVLIVGESDEHHEGPVE